MTSKRDPKEPNGVPEEPKGAPWHSKGSSKEAYIHKNSRSTAPAAVMLSIRPPPPIIRTRALLIRMGSPNVNRQYLLCFLVRQGFLWTCM